MKFHDQNDALEYFRNILGQTKHDSVSLAHASAGMLLAAAEIAGIVASSRTELKKAIDLQVAIITARAMITYDNKTEIADVRVRKSTVQ